MEQHLHNSVYIPSVEANDLYCHMYRDKDIKFKHVGMIPSSLELEKLVVEGLKVNKNKTSEKQISNDVINVKFKQKVKSASEMISLIKKKIVKMSGELTESQKNYKEKLTKYIDILKENKNLDAWKSMSSENLRQKLYGDGFTITTKNPRTNKVSKIKYVVYKRSSAKSRVGQCLFIREELYNAMATWSRMNLPFEDFNIDVPSFLAYQSLIGSSLVDTVKIKPENILLVDDVSSVFKQMCNVVRKADSGFLDSFLEDVNISNSLFDGESLLEKSYFKKDQGMILLRNHMFKSAAFNCNIQDYFKDYFNSISPGGNYNEFKIPTMFEGISIYAKDVQMITTPSSLKALKFSNILGSDYNMFEHWKEFISNPDGYSIFGIVKSEKSSRHYPDDEGNIMQQTSYQMLNCLPLMRTDISELTQYEHEFVGKLKNDDDFFIGYLKKFANSVNSNNMFVSLYEKNNSIVNTDIFREFRKGEINRHVSYIKTGKIRLHGDYCTMLGNPMEYLDHALGIFDINNKSPHLKGNEIYTELFDFNKEVVGFRNPNTSPSNVLIAINTYNHQIDKYFNLTKNIVCVNAIGFSIQDILSGSDYDSDTVLLFDNPLLLNVAKKCFNQYYVCVNRVESCKKSYQLTNLDIASIDNQLSMSQKNIGRVVNLGQFCMSVYWHLLNNGGSEKSISKLLTKIDVMTVLSGICIDLAKKLYDVSIDKEVDEVSKLDELKVSKPKFWMYVSQNKDTKTSPMDCPMDFLFDNLSKVENANQRERVAIKELLVKRNVKDGDRKQISKIENYITQMDSKFRRTYAKIKDEDERIKIINEIIKYYEFYVGKLNISPDTMSAMLLKAVESKKGIVTRLMNTLYKTHRDEFLDAFIG